MNILKIELGDSDGFLNDGQPTMVIVHVVLDNGKRITFPYEATKSIASLYGAVERALGTGSPSPTFRDNAPAAAQQLQETLHALTGGSPAGDPNKIERGDIVRFTAKTDSDSPAELVTGREYRVLDIEAQNGLPVLYGIIDDKATNRIRLDVPVDTVVLVKKAPPKTKKMSGPSESVHKCDCGEEVVLTKDGDKFIGECEKCQAGITVSEVAK